MEWPVLLGVPPNTPPMNIFLFIMIVPFFLMMLHFSEMMVMMRGMMLIPLKIPVHATLIGRMAVTCGCVPVNKPLALVVLRLTFVMFVHTGVKFIVGLWTPAFGEV